MPWWPKLHRTVAKLASKVVIAKVVKRGHGLSCLVLNVFIYCLSLQMCIDIYINICNCISYPLSPYRPCSEQPMRALSEHHDRFKFQRTATHHPGSLQWGPTYANVQLANGKPQCKWIQNIQLKTPLEESAFKKCHKVGRTQKYASLHGGFPFVKNFTTMIYVPILWYSWFVTQDCE